MKLVLEPFEGSNAEHETQGVAYSDCIDGRNKHDWFTEASPWDGPLIWQRCSYCRKRQRIERKDPGIFKPPVGCSRTGY